MSEPATQVTETKKMTLTEIAEDNRKKKEKLKEERAKDNISVLKSYRIK